MKLLHVVKQKFDTGPLDLDKLCKSNRTQNMGSLQTPVFSRNNWVFLTGPTIFRVFEALG